MDIVPGFSPLAWINPIYVDIRAKTWIILAPRSQFVKHRHNIVLMKLTLWSLHMRGIVAVSFEKQKLFEELDSFSVCFKY